MNQSKIKTVLVGGGYFGQKRIKACLDLKNDLSIVGIVDSDQQKLKSVKKNYSLPTFNKLSDIKEKFDLAIISTPNNTHAELSIQALSMGANVLCEKPLASNSKDALRIVKAAKKYELLVKTGSNHRFFSSVQKAFELYKNGEIGELLSFRGSIGNTGQQTANSWFWQKETSGGGTFIDNGCHLIDIARMFMGDFEKCVGHTDQLFWKKANVEDFGTSIFYTKKQKHAMITSSWLQWHGYLYFELWGNNGYIIVDSRDQDTLKLGKKNNPLCTIYDFSNYPKNSYHQEILYFVDCIRKKTQPHPNAEDGYQVIKMIEAIYESSEQKKWINL